eukprot:TRINITY_DN4208_c0_g1_i4.p1 TRINITY_DN4208_c0_g1~~TRINITY_DN4208_c0_g1_i4.p1  ORF type:complete len:693 (+),score=168.25 TRINITY_DN4208_c0_g1_i4:129-2207(+)
MGRTFYLEDVGSGLFLTCQDPLDQTSSVTLQPLEFSTKQTWYRSEKGNMLMCGDGKVLEKSGWGGLRMSDWSFSGDKIFKFEYEDKCIRITHESMCLENIGDNEVDLVPYDQSKAGPWRAIPTEKGFYWAEANVTDSDKDVTKEALSISSGYFGRAEIDGTLHMGLATGGPSPGSFNCYAGFHDENLLSTGPFYLQHESGLYLTNLANESFVELASLEFLPTQTWYWSKQENNKYILRIPAKILSCSGGYASMTNSHSEGDTNVLFSQEEAEEGYFFIKNQSEDEEMFIGVKEMYGKPTTMLGKKDDADMQFKWRAVSVEQAYKWSEMKSMELPENALCVGNAEGDGADVFIGRGQVNGKLHQGKACSGKRYIGYHCRTNFDYRHCNHCCNRVKCQNSDYKNEDNFKEVETEYFSVLCVAEGAEWIPFPQSTPPPYQAYSYDWSVFPKNAVIGGINHDSFSVLYYVGRGLVDGTMVQGFFSPSYKETKLSAFHEGKVHQIEEFEMLVVNKENIEVTTEQKKNDPEISYFGVDNIAKDVNEEKFSILCLDSDTEINWVTYEKDKLPGFAVLAGIFNENAYYVGRGKLEDGTFHLGMFLPRRNMTQSEEDVPHKLYVINKEDMKIHKIDQFEVLVAKPPECKLFPAGGEAADLYDTIDINDDETLDEYWEHIQAAIKLELKKGTIRLAKRKDIK